MSRKRRRRARSSFTGLYLLVALVAVVLLLRGCGGTRPGSATRSAPRPGTHSTSRAGERPVAPRPPTDPQGGGAIGTSAHVALGVPRDGDPSDDVLVDEHEYVLSYNPTLHVPNWVAWKLEGADIGHVHRRDDFRADELLPAPAYRVTPHDYAHSGYDRGHLCPSADRSASEAANSLTFLMSNMQPQLHELNAGPWEQLEELERRRAEVPGSELYIVAGGVFGQGPTTIGHGVAVPSASYKIIVEMRRGQNAHDVTAATPVTAVVMPNEHGVGAHAWSDYLTTVDRVEEATGYDFLSAVPEGLQQVIESRVAVVP